jgi:hypothetical protein
MTRSANDRSDFALFPNEAEVARLVLGRRAAEWPGKAVVLEREGLPKIDPLMGGRFWPSVFRWFCDRYGLDAASSDAPMMGKSRIRIVPFAPDGMEDFDGEKAQAARGQRRDRRTQRTGFAAR